ncbi:hypothetical protein [Actinomadura rudentiformis]|uniref:Uncharacterized protein n=1 Tax=Actinomadura rudentiformis TaxID=359158 RepID=A0A6H9YUR0_9ACTN|nr:hypothetical protein [Actinomadura rudentiformis]KAB2352261.1 hypothetical protein F8566_00710 [Actinomadura rudentiformis]
MAQRAQLWNDACAVYATLIDGGDLPVQATQLFVGEGEKVFLQDYYVGWRTSITLTYDEIIMALGAENFYQRSDFASQAIQSTFQDDYGMVTSHLTDQRLIIMTAPQTRSLWHRDLIAINGRLNEAGNLVPEEFNVAYDGHRPQTIYGPAALGLTISLAWAAGGAHALQNPVFGPVAAAVSAGPR